MPGSYKPASKGARKRSLTPFKFHEGRAASSRNDWEVEDRCEISLPEAKYSRSVAGTLLWLARHPTLPA